MAWSKFLRHFKNKGGEFFKTSYAPMVLKIINILQNYYFSPKGGPKYFQKFDNTHPELSFRITKKATLYIIFNLCDVTQGSEGGLKIAKFKNWTFSYPRKIAKN